MKLFSKKASSRQFTLNRDYHGMYSDQTYGRKDQDPIQLQYSHQIPALQPINYWAPPLPNGAGQDLCRNCTSAQTSATYSCGRSSLETAPKSTMDVHEILRTTKLYYMPIDKRLLSIPTKPPIIRDNQDQADIVDGSMISFTEKLQGQVVADILNATLFAQILANMNVDRTKNPIGWYFSYTQCLIQIGFSCKNFTFDKYSTSSQSFQISSVVLEKLQAVALPLGFGVLSQALNALRGLPDSDYSVVLFNTQSENVNSGNFQMCVADQDPNGDIVLTTGAFDFQADRQVTRFLWFSWPSTSITLNYGTQNLVFNDQLYSTYRQAIIEYLGSSRQTYIADIAL